MTCVAGVSLHRPGWPPNDRGRSYFRGTHCPFTKTRTPYLRKLATENLRVILSKIETEESPSTGFCFHRTSDFCLRLRLPITLTSPPRETFVAIVAISFRSDFRDLRCLRGDLTFACQTTGFRRVASNRKWGAFSDSTVGQWV